MPSTNKQSHMKTRSRVETYSNTNPMPVSYFPDVNRDQKFLSGVSEKSLVLHKIMDKAIFLSTVLYTDKIMDYHAAHVAREEWKSGTLGIMTQQHEGYNRFRYVIPRKMATPQPRTCAWIGERPKCPWCYAEKMRYRQNNECTCGECNSKKPCDHPTPVWLEYEQNNE